jgi:hypothetical protein
MASRSTFTVFATELLPHPKSVSSGQPVLATRNDQTGQTKNFPNALKKFVSFPHRNRPQGLSAYFIRKFAAKAKPNFPSPVVLSETFSRRRDIKRRQLHLEWLTFGRWTLRQSSLGIVTRLTQKISDAAAAAAGAPVSKPAQRCRKRRTG